MNGAARIKQEIEDDQPTSSSETPQTSGDSWILKQIYQELLTSKERNRVLEGRISSIEKFGKERALKEQNILHQATEILEFQMKVIEEWKAKNEEEFGKIHKKLNEFPRFGTSGQFMDQHINIQNDELNQKFDKLHEETQRIQFKLSDLTEITTRNVCEFIIQLGKVQKEDKTRRDEFKKTQWDLSKLIYIQENSTGKMGEIIENKLAKILETVGNSRENVMKNEPDRVVECTGIEKNTDGLSISNREETPVENLEIQAQREDGELSERSDLSCFISDYDKRIPKQEPAESSPDIIVLDRVQPNHVSSERNSFPPPPKNRACLFCNHPAHMAAACHIYRTSKSRRQQLITKNICKRCLEPKDQKHKTCPMKHRKCPYCSPTGKNRHHPLVCPEKGSWSHYIKRCQPY